MMDSVGSITASKVAQQVIMFMHCLYLMYSALEFCNGDTTIMAKIEWSRVGVNVIGIIQGTSSGASAKDLGKLMYLVLKQTCTRFGNCYYLDSFDESSLVPVLRRGTNYAISFCIILGFIVKLNFIYMVGRFYNFYIKYNTPENNFDSLISISFHLKFFYLPQGYKESKFAVVHNIIRPKMGQIIVI